MGWDRGWVMALSQLEVTEMLECKVNLTV